MSLVFPNKVIDQHLVVLGKTGAGKSSALRHIVEHLLDHKKRVCIIDPKGDWNGLKVSADGKSSGYPIILFGDFKETAGTQIKADVPLNESSGKHVGELVATGNRPCVIGMRGWTQGAMHRLWIDFASTVFNKNSGELYLVIDEVHNFGPKGKIMSPEVGKSLHWTNRVMNEGRGIGLVNLIASQRPQKVHNDTLTACETLVAMRVVHTADRNAVEEWIDGCGDKERGKEVLNALAGMARGEAFVWSPEVGFGPERLKFPMFSTFDSFAPPQLQKKVSASSWADVDLEAVKEKMASVIEEAKANDPSELKRTIADLKRKLDKAERTPGEVKQEKVEVQVLDEAAKKLLEKVWQACDQVIEEAESRRVHFQELAKQINSLRAEVSTKIAPCPFPRPQVRKQKWTPPPRQVASNGHSERLPKGEKAILIALAQHGGCYRDQLTVLTGYRRSSRDAYIQRLREKDFATAEGDEVRATDNGIAALGSDFQPLPTGDALREHYLQTLPIGQRAILETLIEQYPNAVDRETLSDSTEYKRSSRDAYLQRLKARRLVEITGRGQVKAAEHLFQ